MYISTRGETSPHGFYEAVAIGLAPDGGLFLPERLPDLRDKIAAWRGLAYTDLCWEFFRGIDSGLDEGTFRDGINAAYAKFDHPDVAPLRRLDENLFVLELFHGPTLAFKDFALQLLGNLYEEQIRRTGKSINVLGATSGDTGAAAIHGLLGKEGVNIFILYPNGRVSPLQERQMTCTGAGNVFPLAIDGTFDDAQRVIKEVFGEGEFSRRHGLSAVNSINLARILAQCVYYIFAWLRLPATKRQNVEFVVPTGNFGNVLAGWMAYKMGLPVAGFRVATNQNDILYRLFSTGHYRVEDVRPSLAPSMDIQVASNLERFLYYMLDRDPARVRVAMEKLKSSGDLDFPDFRSDIFRASRADDHEIREIIHRVYREHGYIIDPHTACGFKEIDPDKVTVALATAHPAKFPDTILESTGMEPRHDRLEALKACMVIKYPIDAESAAIKRFIEDRAGGAPR